jgi:hypothetical protein
MWSLCSDRLMNFAAFVASDQDIVIIGLTCQQRQQQDKQNRWFHVS